METRRYRPTGCAMFAGGLFFIVGLVIFANTSYHYASGIPLVQSNGKFSSGGTHIASSSELLFSMVGSFPLLLFGGFIILLARNSGFTVDSEGIVATNAFGKKFFRANWSEVTALDRMNNKPGSGYTLKANGKTLAIQSSTTNMKDLVADIRSNSPNLAD